MMIKANKYMRLNAIKAQINEQTELVDNLYNKMKLGVLIDDLDKQQENYMNWSLALLKLTELNDKFWEITKNV